MTVKVKQFIAIILGVIILVIGIFIWRTGRDDSPQFFPIDNPQGKYLITKNCPQQGWQDKPRIPGNLYCVIYSGPDVLLSEENSENVFTIMVGKSEIELKEFEDKYVRIKGAFVNSSEQCIVNTCSAINGPRVVLNINAITVVR